jgi:MtrB/PioB family decaheme-associated outer membrane protein
MTTTTFSHAGSVLIFTPLLGLLPTAAYPGPNAAVSARERGWTCQRCPVEQGVSGEMEVGVVRVPTDSFKFGDYTGLNEDKVYLTGDAEAHYRGKDARYGDVEGSNLGLESRTVDIEGGRQGDYELGLWYDELPHLVEDSAATPFLNTGSSQDFLALPDNWVPANTTRNMTTLPTSLQEVDIHTKRKTLQGGFSYLPSQHVELVGKVNRIKKEGTDAIGGAIGSSFGSSRASILRGPIDYETYQVDFSASYTRKRFQSQLGYYGSFFDDQQNSLTWMNPFVDTASANSLGRLAPPPDNRFNQLYASLGYDITSHTRASAYLAIGRMTQDENFMPYTTNANLPVLALPTNSLDGEVDTRLVDIKLSSRPLPRLRLSAQYKYDERDNKTDQNTYDYVIADTALSTNARTNLPYGYQQNLWKLEAGYQLPGRTEISAGFDYDRFERPLQEVDETRDKTFWSRFKFRPLDRLDAWVKYAYADRSASNYQVIPAIVPPQNPQMRLFYMAERERNEISASISLLALDDLNIDLTGFYAKDDYNDTSIGLIDADDLSYTVDLSYTPLDNVSAYLFYTFERIESKQRNSASFAAQVWDEKSRDSFDTLGVGVKVEAIRRKLDLGADYLYSRGRGEIDVQGVGGVTDSFPNLKTRLHGFSLYADYKLRPNMSVKAGYRYEKYDSSNWSLDDVSTNTIPSVLSLGSPSPYYTQNVYSLSLQYQFE